MWAAQFMGFEEPKRWMTSGGLGTMGYGFPASIGVQLAHPESLVINVAGEASWLMNMQELGTAVQYNLPVKQFILNNDMNGNGYERRVPFSPRFRDQWPVILFEFQWLSVFAVSLVRLR